MTKAESPPYIIHLCFLLCQISILAICLSIELHPPFACYVIYLRTYFDAHPLGSTHSLIVLPPGKVSFENTSLQYQTLTPDLFW